jgi:transposase
MIVASERTRVYLALGATDMRKQIDALAVLVEDVLDQDPFSEAMFVFCNRGRDKLKILYWQRNGFWLGYRRLERERFRWPRAAEVEGASLEISVRELRWLLDGLDMRRLQGHREATFRVL